MAVGQETDSASRAVPEMMWDRNTPERVVKQGLRTIIHAPAKKSAQRLCLPGDMLNPVLNIVICLGRKLSANTHSADAQKGK